MSKQNPSLFLLLKEYILYLLLFVTPFENSSVNMLPFTIAGIAGVLLIGVWAARAFSLQPEPVILTSSHGPFLIFIVLCGFSVFYSVDPYTSRLLFWSERVLMFSVFVAALQAFEDGLSFQRIKIVLAAWMALLSIHALLQFFTRIQASPIFADPNLEFRAHALFSWPTSLGGFLILTLPLWVTAFFQSDRAKTAMTWSGLIGIQWAALMATYTRGAWLSILAVFCLMAVLCHRSGLRAPAKRVVSLAVILVMISVFFLTPNRFTTTESLDRAGQLLKLPTNESFSNRPLIWQSTLKMIEDRPIFGSGIGTFELVYYRYRSAAFQNQIHPFAHNDYLQVAVELGIIGFLVWLWLLYRVFRPMSSLLSPPAAEKLSQEARWNTLGMICGVIAVSIHSFVDYDLYIPAIQVVFWIFVAFVIQQAASSGVVVKTTLRIPAVIYGREGIRRTLVGLTAVAALTAVISITKPWIGSVYNLRANHWFKKGELQTALRMYQTAVAYVPDAENYHLNLAAAYERLAKRTEDRKGLQMAEEQYKKAVELIPEDFNAYREQGLFYYRQGEKEKAVESVLKAVRLFPTSGDLYRLLGRLHAEAGHGREADAAFRRSEDLALGL